MNLICLALIVSMGELSVSAISNTSFDCFSVQDIFKILLWYQISAASSLFLVLLVIVQHLQPYKRIDHTYVCIILNLVSILMCLLAMIDDSLLR